MRKNGLQKTKLPSMSMTLPLHIQQAQKKAVARIASGFDRFLLYEFQYLEEHRAFAGTHFLQNAKSFKEQFSADLAKMDENERQDYAEFMIEEYTKAVEVLPRLQWYAQFLVVYSSFEHALNELCRIVKNRSGFSLSQKDLEGQGVRRAANYLCKVANVHPPFQSPEWNRALLLGEIRNVIAHRNGEIEFNLNDKKSLSHRIQGVHGLQLKQIVTGMEDAELVLDTDFVRDAIKVLRKVLTDIANYPLYDNEG